MIELRKEYEIKSRRLRSQKVVIAEEELVGIDKNDIVNLEDLLIVVFFNQTNINLLDPILGTRDRNCYTMKNL